MRLKAFEYGFGAGHVMTRLAYDFLEIFAAKRFQDQGHFMDVRDDGDGIGLQFAEKQAVRAGVGINQGNFLEQIGRGTRISDDDRFRQFAKFRFERSEASCDTNRSRPRGGDAIGGTASWSN